MSVEVAVSRRIESLKQRDAEIGESPEAELALALARRIDDARNSATSVSMNASKLLEALAALRALVPDEKRGSPLDEIRARRDRKLAGKPASAAGVAPRRRKKTS